MTKDFNAPVNENGFQNTWEGFNNKEVAAVKCIKASLIIAIVTDIRNDKSKLAKLTETKHLKAVNDIINGGIAMSHSIDCLIEIMVLFGFNLVDIPKQAIMSDEVNPDTGMKRPLEFTDLSICFKK